MFFCTLINTDDNGLTQICVHLFPICVYQYAFNLQCFYPKLSLLGKNDNFYLVFKDPWLQCCCGICAICASVEYNNQIATAPERICEPDTQIKLVR